ncbi:MAG: hypothetical protein M0008_12485 [Actinomycetota bacterium]|nr:hypothetical protein [Actinomycetota bacterium]
MPRVENGAGAISALRDALVESGVDCRLLENGAVEVAGLPTTR